jgi:hypothetical protein
MPRRAYIAFWLFLGCLLAGQPGKVFAQTDSLRPRVILPFDSLVMDVYGTFQPPAVKAVSYKGDSLPVDTLGRVDTAHIGLYVIRYVAVDTSVQRSDTATFRVYVMDRKRPRITLLGNLYVTVRQGGTYQEPGVAIADNYDFNPQLLTRGTFKDTKSTGLFYIVYQAKDSSGNLSNTALRFIEIVDSAAVGIHANELEMQLSIYPNPATDLICVKTKLPFLMDALLVTPQGRVTKVAHFRKELFLPVSDVPPGIYFLQIRYGALAKSVPVLIAR